MAGWITGSQTVGILSNWIPRPFGFGISTGRTGAGPLAAVRRLEPVAHLAIARQRQPLFRHHWPCNVAAQTVPFPAVVRPGCDTRMHRESSHLARRLNGRLIALRQGLPREHLAPRVRAQRDAIRDPVAQELNQRTAFHRIAGQIAVLGIAFHQPPALQETSDAPSYGVPQVGQLSTARRLHPTKSRARPIRAIDVDTIEKKYMQVKIQIEGTSQALHQRDGIGAGRGAGSYVVRPWRNADSSSAPRRSLAEVGFFSKERSVCFRKCHPRLLREAVSAKAKNR